MANPILGIGISGLAAAQAGLSTTGHNIANVNTRGYSRQEIIQAPNLSQYTGSGFLGRGVSVDTVHRAYDTLLQAQSWQVEASGGHAQAMLDQVGRIDRLVADPEAGLSPALDGFFGSLQDLAGQPGDMAARQGVLSQARALMTRFHDVDGQFSSLQTEVNGRIGNAVNFANSITAQIAQLNHRIVIAKATGSGQQLPNDLLDKRDALVQDLAAQIRAVVVEQGDGSYSVFMGNGQPLVLKDGANKLTVFSSAEDPQRLQVGLQVGASTLKFRASELSGGQLGGVLAFRDDVLLPARNGFGRIAMTLAAATNDQHRLGQDRFGALGGDFFVVPAPRIVADAGNSGSATLAASIGSYPALTASDYRLTYDGAGYTLTRLADGSASNFATLPQTVDGVSLAIGGGAIAAGDRFLIQPTQAGAGGIGLAVSDAGRIAAAAPIRTSAAIANAGDAAVSAGTVNVPAPPNVDLQQPVTLTFTSATSFDVTGAGTGNPTGVGYVSGGSISYNGWTLRISGTPMAGDRFTVGPNTGGNGDNRNALALAALQTGKLMTGGNDTLLGAYSQLVSDIGNRTQEARIEQSAQASLASEVEQARSAASGVNLDEEAANLLRYQQAYQASGKIIAMAGQLFNTILELGR